MSPACPSQLSSSDGFVSPQVTVRAGAGADEFSVSVTCPALCDGQWHTISGEVTAPLVLGLCSSPAQPTSGGAQGKPRPGNLNPITLPYALNLGVCSYHEVSFLINKNSCLNLALSALVGRRDRLFFHIVEQLARPRMCHRA